MPISREVRTEHAVLHSISMIDVSIECDRSADPDQSRPDGPRRGLTARRQTPATLVNELLISVIRPDQRHYHRQGSAKNGSLGSSPKRLHHREDNANGIVVFASMLTFWSSLAH
jgi:hypothetical protein